MTTWLNLIALVMALGLSLIAVASTHREAQPRASGSPAHSYARIVSLGIVSDAALADLCEPQRVVGVSAWSTGPVARRWADKPQLRGLDDLEALIALRPDLVLVSSAGGDTDRLERLHAAGINVIVLGPMQGLATYVEDLATIGDLLGRGAEARASGKRLQMRLARVADPTAPRVRAIYVAGFGGTLFGGTRGTSYHDVLTAAGCLDLAAERYTGWPQYSSEQVLALHPDVVVTKIGAELPVIPGARIIALPGDLLEDPGPRLLEAAEALAEQVRALPPASRDTATSH